VKEDVNSSPWVSGFTFRLPMTSPSYSRCEVLDQSIHGLLRIHNLQGRSPRRPSTQWLVRTRE